MIKEATPLVIINSRYQALCRASLYDESKNFRNVPEKNVTNSYMV